MLTETTYKEKFSQLSFWLPSIIDSIKKDLKNEHLKNDWNFVRTYFPGKNPAKLVTEELVDAYSQALANSEGAEQLAEFIANRWLLKHSELYYFFEQELKKINPNFNEITAVADAAALPIMESAIHTFGAPQAYLFCMLNSVAFSEKMFQTLSQKAEQGVKQMQKETESKLEQQSLENMQKNYEQQIARLTDKYEKKLLGLQRKYVQDTDSLKKQIAALQRKQAC